MSKKMIEVHRTLLLHTADDISKLTAIVSLAATQLQFIMRNQAAKSPEPEPMSIFQIASMLELADRGILQREMVLRDILELDAKE